MTGTYKFYSTCDDSCVVLLSETDMDSSAAAEIIRQSSYVPNGQYWYDDSTASDEKTLTAGEHYYIEMRHVNGGGHGHAALLVEFSPTDTSTLAATHHQAKREVQVVSITATDVVFDTTIITIDNPDDGTFTVSFSHAGGPGNKDKSGTYASDSMPTKLTASTCKSGTKGFFSDVHSTSITATVEMTDAAGAVTTDKNLAA